jgi:Putative MetA-pathway of phenol degradation
MKRRFMFAVATAAALGTSLAHASCGSAFCMANTNWGVQGVWNEPGWFADFRFEYIDQDQPRRGSERVSVGQFPQHHDEVETINRNYIGTLAYGFTPEWGVSVVVPWVDRDHSHIHNHRGQPILETWKFNDLGDVRLQAGYQRMLSSDLERPTFFGLLGGIKLRTGKTDVTNAEGAVAERSLQPGTGTTDLVLGGFYRAMLPNISSSWFTQIAAKQALNSQDNYRPGTQVELDFGYRYDVNDKIALMLQLNYQWKDRDSGSEAEPNDSGGQTLALTPGVSVAVAPNVNVYGLVQLPVYQYVNGIQLTADWAAVVGINASF